MDPSSSIQSILVLGGGSAGLLAALTLKRRLPSIQVTVLRSPHLGIIGVGEGTTPYFPRHLHGYLGLAPAPFYETARPIWKLGIHYLWGPRPNFHYTFTSQTDFRFPDLPKNNGYYCDEDFADTDLSSSLMSRGKVFPRQPNGQPRLIHHYAYHVENALLVEYLEARALEAGVVVADGTVTDVHRRADGGVQSLRLDDDRVMNADFFVDASGFSSELIGRAMAIPFESFSDSLFTDRAVVGGWQRTENEPILPFTTAETMEAGWAWRIDHEEVINRGYVYSSSHLDDDQAEEEFRRKNPSVRSTRIVRFRTGFYRQQWVGNVVAMGNASGFVEPLEATALMVICMQSRALADGLIECDRQPTPSLVRLYNAYAASLWHEIRDFLSIHYRFNHRIDSAFWRHCHEETELHGAGPIVDYYQENGPSALAKSMLLNPNSPFGLEGYYTLLVGQKVPYQRRHEPSSSEWHRWNAHRARHRTTAAQAVGVRQALEAIRSPRWRWDQTPAIPA